MTDCRGRELFRQGMQRVQEGARSHQVALMCAEKEPLECHRAILIARHLTRVGIEVQHILADGELEPHADAMSRLTKMFRMDGGNLFQSPEEVLADVYQRQEQRIAHELVPAAAHALA